MTTMPTALEIAAADVVLGSLALHDLPAICERVLAARPEPRFLVHSGLSIAGPEITASIDAGGLVLTSRDLNIGRLNIGDLGTSEISPGQDHAQ